jgi:hypothetical protein
MARSSFAVLLIMVSCGADPAPKPVPAEFRISAIKNKDDAVQVESRPGAAVIRVKCNHGIGSCIVTPFKGKWPEHVTLLLEGLGVLEDFRFQAGRIRAEGGLKASGHLEFGFLGSDPHKWLRAGHLDVRVERHKTALAIEFPSDTLNGSDAAEFEWIEYLLR